MTDQFERFSNLVGKDVTIVDSSTGTEYECYVTFAERKSDSENIEMGFRTHHITDKEVEAGKAWVKMWQEHGITEETEEGITRYVPDDIRAEYNEKYNK